jgi:hypothetical protein
MNRTTIYNKMKNYLYTKKHRTIRGYRVESPDRVVGLLYPFGERLMMGVNEAAVLRAVQRGELVEVEDQAQQISMGI